MTANEIIKSLHICAENDCGNDCVFQGSGGSCGSRLMLAAVNLLENQTKEIQTLKDENRKLKG